MWAGNIAETCEPQGNALWEGVAVDFEVLVDDTFASFNNVAELNPIELKHLLSLANDFEDGKWRNAKFDGFIWDHVAETALSQRERTALVDSNFSALRASAKNLRLTDKITDPTKGSEIAEILLYGIMKRHFGALPVVPKIFYKQNANDFAKGADSVHIVVDGDNFSLWFGEAKFYNSIEDSRLGAVIDSIQECLSTAKLRKESSIVTNVRDLDDLPLNEELRDRIKASLSPKVSIDEIKICLHVPILLLHECAITGSATSMTENYKNSLRVHHKERAQAFFGKQIAGLSSKVAMYERISFHLLLVPVPSKAEIVDSFISKAEVLKG